MAAHLRLGDRDLVVGHAGRHHEVTLHLEPPHAHAARRGEGPDHDIPADTAISDKLHRRDEAASRLGDDEITPHEHRCPERRIAPSHARSHVETVRASPHADRHVARRADRRGDDDEVVPGSGSDSQSGVHDHGAREPDAIGVCPADERRGTEHLHTVGHRDSIIARPARDAQIPVDVDERPDEDLVRPCAPDGRQPATDLDAVHHGQLVGPGSPIDADIEQRAAAARQRDDVVPVTGRDQDAAERTHVSKEDLVVPAAGANRDHASDLHGARGHRVVPVAEVDVEPAERRGRRAPLVEGAELHRVVATSHPHADLSNRRAERRPDPHDPIRSANGGDQRLLLQRDDGKQSPVSATDPDGVGVVIAGDGEHIAADRHADDAGEGETRFEPFRGERDSAACRVPGGGGLTKPSLRREWTDGEHGRAPRVPGRFP